MPYTSTATGREKRMRRAYDSDIAKTGEIGDALTGGFTTGIQEDPRASFQRSVKAAFEMFRERLGEEVGDLRSQQSGMNRLDTGFATEDEDRLVEGLGEDLNNRIADRGLHAESLNQGRLRTMGSIGNSFSERAISATGGSFETERAQRLQDEADRRRGFGDLLSAGISGAASIATGPIGGAIADRFIRKKKS